MHTPPPAAAAVPPAWPRSALGALCAVSLAAVAAAGCQGGRGSDEETQARRSASDGAATAGAAAEAPPAAAPGRLFTRLPSSYTGIRFANRVVDTREVNVFTYRNFYNGGGVAIGDLTGDGLPEIVLSSNQGGSRLYLNEGKFRFRDVTARSGIGGPNGAWTTGVALADVNGDGRLDVYVSRAGKVEPALRANALYVNTGATKEGVPTFVDSAAAYGVADHGYTTQAAFLDYDRDGDLDLFLINNSPRPVNSFGLRNTRNVRDAFGGAKLYRNEGGGRRFTDVSEKAGIFGSEIGFGLGVAASDVNGDGWPDLYVSNDFFEHDYLYVNNRDGTFTESLERQMPYSSYFSMGLDVADVNNDGRPDVYTTDMLPEDEYRLKTTSSFEGWDVYQAKVRNGYHYQFMRNMLQLNNGNGTFSDVAQMAGVERTDWSWSALIADFDLDGSKDVFVTNGLTRDVTSQDYVAFLANEATVAEATKGGAGRVDFMRLINAMSSTPISNYAFRNRGDLTFSNEAKAWGLDTPSFSNGAAYGDLDGDGALDLVVNNANQEAFVYRNDARTLRPENHFLQVKLEGEGKNRFGVGAKVTAYAGGRLQVVNDPRRSRDQLYLKVDGPRDTYMQELSPTRGFQSSVDYVLTFGVGRYERVDSVRVDWPDGRVGVLLAMPTNRRLTFRQAEAIQPPPSTLPAARSTLLTAVTDSARLDFVHRENDFVDFDRERLMPKMVSAEGPAMAVGDVNGDGLDDVYFGGAKDQAGELLVQQRDGSFRRSNPGLFEQDQISEDVGALFFDANGDRRPDLYVVSGGNDYSADAPALQDRLYLNDGGGRFHKADGSVPAESNVGSRVAAADYDADGDQDLFVGGRVVPFQYGVVPRSVLLQNDGRGHFTDVTDRLAPQLAQAGLVTDALWRDVDGDRRADLVVVGEWMPITVFHNAGQGRLTPASVRGFEKSHGWWNRIVAGDFTGDGRVDFVVANLGLNSRLHEPTPSEPVALFVKDFDGNGFVEQVLSCYNRGVSYPVPLRDDLIKVLPYLKARFLNYKDYARVTTAALFTPAELEGAVVQKAYTFSTALARNNGDGTFTLVPLPREAQLAPVYGVLADDFDRDGKRDLLLAGNFDGFKPEIGKMDASYGLLLRGDGRGAFVPVPAERGGFFVPGQARDIQRLRTRSGGPLYVVARNNDRPLVFRAGAPRPGVAGERTLALRAPAGTTTPPVTPTPTITHRDRP